MRPEGEDSGDIDGDMPLGNVTSPMRLKACCRAKYLSVEFSNVMMTSERPYREIERMVTICGMPFIPRSTGTVFSCTTSPAAWPGHCVISATIGGDRSG